MALWTPAQLGSALGVYLDANLGVTLGTGSDVASWADQGPNAYTAAQATVAKRPAFIAAGSSNLGTGPALRTTASNTTQGMTGLPSQLGGASSILVALSGGFVAAQIDFTTGGTGASSKVSSIAFGNPILFGIVSDSTAGVVSFYANGTLLGTTTPATINTGSFFFLTNPVSGNSGARVYDVSGGETLFNRASGSRTFDGDFGALVEATTAVSTSVRQQVEGWALWNWGLEANLPPSHPYYSAAPTTGSTYPLAGSSSSTSTGSGALGYSTPLTGAATTTSSGSGAIGATDPLAGTSATTSSGAGALGYGGSLAGAGSTASAGAGALGPTLALAGAGSSTSAGVGDVGQQSGSDKGLAGSGASASFGSGAILVSAALQGAGTSTSSGVGTLAGGQEPVLYTLEQNAALTPHPVVGYLRGLHGEIVQPVVYWTPPRGLLVE